MKMKVSGEMSEKFLVDSSYYVFDTRFVPCKYLQIFESKPVKPNFFVFTEARNGRLRNVATAANRLIPARSLQAMIRLQMSQTVMMVKTAAISNPRRIRCVNTQP